MIDLHLHVLPGIDDGAVTTDVSRAMLGTMGRMGFTQVVSTPHLMQPLTPEYHHAVIAEVDRLRPVAAEYNIGLGFGYEHMLSPGLPRRLGDGEPSTLAGSRAVLTELPFVGWPAFTDTTLFELRLAGFHPVLAHPERYVAVQENPELALEAGSRGTVLQLTTGSFAGVYGRTVERSAFRLLEAAIDRDIPILLATDAHSEGQRLALVPAGIDRIRKQVADGGSVVAWASRAVPEALLANRVVTGFAEWYALHPDQDAAVDTVAANGSTGHRGRAGRLRQALRLGSPNRS